ncbi:MAG: hypothetical protein ABIJ82_04155 [Patescibacteria group bacterium]|nr:hypothetical protein [Patescibacteria group bacterium]MBU1952631.1 hypothetical protein [Patescibacteria group bacterium]
MKKIFNTTNLVYLLLVIFGTLVSFKPPSDPDFGWHYKYGEYFVQHGKILRDNIFSYTNTNYEWSNSYWVAELVMYLSHHFLGSVYSTLILSFALSVILLVIIKKQTRNLLNISINYILLSVSLSIYALTVRPFYYSTVFMFFLFYLLIFKKDWIRLLPFVFLIWANTHADFVPALFVYGVYCLDNWVQKTIRTKDSKNLHFQANSFLDSFKIFFLCVFSTLLNPYGIKLWATLAKELTQPIKSLVNEWGPFDFSFSNTTTLFISFLLAVGLISSFSVFKRKKDQFGWWYKILIIFFYILSIKACYFGRLFFIMSSFAIIQELEILVGSLPAFFKSKKVYLPKVSLPVFLVLLSFAASSLFIENVSLASDISKWSTEGKYPYNALGYIKKNPMGGNMWNTYNWGGYLIWQLPEYKTFIDGRMAAWNENGKFFIKEYRLISYDPEKYSDLLNKYLSDYNITWILDIPKSKVIKYLLEKSNQNSQWKSVYEDEISIIIKKK